MVRKTNPLSVLAIVGCLLFGAVPNVQGNDARTFNQLVLEAMAARGAIESAEFKYSVTHYSKDGDEFEWKKEGQFAFDDRVKKIAHRFTILFSKEADAPNPFGHAPGNGIAVANDDGIQYRGGAVYSPKITLLFMPSAFGGQLKIIETPNRSDVVLPFDYRSFGFAFYGDVEIRAPFEKVLGNYLLMKDDQTPEVQKKNLPKSFLPVAKDARYFQYGPTFLCVQPEKGFWVTRQLKEGPVRIVQNDGTRRIGTEIRSKCTLYLMEKDGHWVPTRALYKAGDRRLDFKIEWLSINPAPGSLDFSYETLSTRLEKPISNVTVR